METSIIFIISVNIIFMCLGFTIQYFCLKPFVENSHIFLRLLFASTFIVLIVQYILSKAVISAWEQTKKDIEQF